MPLRTYTPSTLSLLVIGLGAALLACQPQPKPERPGITPPVAARHAHADIYNVDSASSSITLKVYRDGPLARLGHNHVIAIEQISGTVFREKSLAQSEVELSFPVVAMAVDRSAERSRAGPDFASNVTPEAVAGTRENMLGPKLLAAQQYPRIALRSVAIGGEWPDLQLVVSVKLRELESQFAVPVRITEQNGVLIAEGSTRLSQVQLGLTPYSVLGGGLRVADGIDAQFHVVAQRARKE